MRFLFITFLVFLFGCNIALKQPNKNDIAETKIELIDSLIKASELLYKHNSDSIPIFDPVLKEAYQTAKAKNNQLKIGEIYNMLGQRHRGKSQYSSAIIYHQQAINIADKINSDMLHAVSTHEMAVIFRRMNDNAQALRLYIESLEWAEAVNDTFLIHCSLNGIGNVYFNYKDYKKSIDYYLRSLNYLGTVNRNYLGEAINTNTLGEAWLFEGNTDSAMHYLKRSFDINVKINSKLGQAICYNGIGLVHFENKDYEKAVESISKALAFDRSELSPSYIAMFLTNLGNTYLKMHNYTEAENTLLKAFSISSKIGSRREALDASEYLTQLYQKKNNLEAAMKYIQAGVAYKDSINRDLIKQTTETMNALYKAEQQEREIIILKQNAELNTLRLDRQRSMGIVMISLLIIFALFVLFVFRQRKLKNLFNQVELEQKLLRSQMNPHFVFNSLAAMQNFIMNNDKMEAADYLANFSRLMRNILMSSRTESIVLDTEIEILQDYLKLQQLRFNNKFDFNLHVSDHIDSEVCLIPPMLIQPFIENSIEHGIREMQNNGHIAIKFEKQDKLLVIEVEDNGVGIQQKETNNNTKHESLATKITLERLKNYERVTRTESKLEIFNKADSGSETGVKVIITIPYQEEE